MNTSVSSILRVRGLAIALALVGAGALFFTMTSDALAVNTISTIKYEESGTADGTVDRIGITMDENVVACTYESSDWTVNTAGSIGVTAITAVSCLTTNTVLNLTTTNDANETGGAVAPVISYANQGQLNSIFLTSGAMGDQASKTVTDGAKPQINTFTYQDAVSGDGKIDTFLIAFGEDVVAASVLTPAGLTLTNVGDFTAAAFGADATDSIAGTVASATLTLGTASTAKDTAEGSGTIAITSQGTFRLDDATGNSNTTLGAQDAIATFADGAAPKITTLTYSDADGDAKVDTVVAAYTESVTSASVISNNDMTLTGVGDFTALAFGATSTDLITSTVSSTTFTLGTESSAKDTEDNAGTFAISTQNLFSLTDGTNAYATLGAQASIATVVDGAKPVISTFDYQDADDDGKIDTIVANFSEEVVAGSVLTPAGLTFTGVGDFTAAAFGADTTDAVAGTVSSATLTLGTESTAKDTSEGAGTIAISSQGTFSLVDTATAANTNNTLGAQSTSATFVDEAAPQIATVTYSDADGDAKVDTLVLAYTETVVAGSVLRHADLTATGVGDFTALAFGAATTDLITASVTSTTITMGTESSAEDTGDDSPALAMTSQANFSLVDAAASPNTNSELEAQMSSSATVADGAAPLLLTTSPASAATGVARTATIVLTYSEPISTASFAWTKTNGPATTNFSSAWTVGDTVNTLTVNGLLSSGSHTIDVTASPDTTSNAYGGAVAAIADPFTFTVIGGSTTSSGTSSTEASYDVDVTAPNGGETLTPGEVKNISWTSSATNSSMSAVNINLIYGNESTTQTTISSNESNDGVYAWTVPDIDTAYAKIQVVGTDLATALATDESDDYFTIGTPAAAGEEEEDTSDEVTAPSSGTTGLSPVTGEEEDISVVAAGQYIRSSYFSTVYYLETNDSGDLIRRPFLDAQTFMTWQDDWSDVATVTDATLPTMELGSPMLPKAGVVLVKITTVAKVYAVEGDGTLRWITSESVASAMYGSNWADYVIDMPDTLFPRFTIGDDIDSAESVDTSIMKTRQEVNS